MEKIDIGKRFVNGGEDELEEIINLYGEKLLHYATAILCDYHEAENIVQEVFLSAYQNRDIFDGNNLSAWLYKITYNRCLNQLKKRKILYFHEIRSEVVLPEKDKGLSDETLRALQKLKPKERALLYGRIMDGQSYEELSQLTGSSPAALRKQYQRAKDKLVKYLNFEYCGKESKYEQI
ncbi:RNA polymerase sigma factor [Schinkia azotoformans]|uniref:ECF subfamily RNA polymerase sigma-24 subunit n=1 Tax=Schinkia azotoformans LMG 9581 TaxID=1131731 RepID=K6D3J2_SCHAZ|nr:RNA polymerase sigma factor [Schinkia azotoformans]EKN62608.1 ECF subfamily RNA polymerase sigma-24 subunit [Schinkia azotoformans LMG 9581]MEC1639316.1 RNA polymerase sigma factor [Schinkia azotoformans]MEC1722986.1 RNA polymerase sigma factor [Schinkia azotoformans]MEC1945903.1 RNA polymerase sigma factor [Schinkia azotoformans]MED4350761.1 RNA polymerase sigma factor [Schinkia azotoformans]